MAILPLEQCRPDILQRHRIAGPVLEPEGTRQFVPWRALRDPRFAAVTQGLIGSRGADDVTANWFAVVGGAEATRAVRSAS